MAVWRKKVRGETLHRWRGRLLFQGHTRDTWWFQATASSRGRMSILQVRPPSWGCGWEWWSRRCRRRATGSKVAQLAMRHGLHFCPNSTTHKLQQISLWPLPQNAYTYIHRSYTLFVTKFLKTWPPVKQSQHPGLAANLPPTSPRELPSILPSISSSSHPAVRSEFSLMRTGCRGFRHSDGVVDHCAISFDESIK